jgi:hypothetical protein
MHRPSSIVRTFAALTLCMCNIAALSATLPATARVEIDALLDRLQASGCTFSRNGTWYTGADAQTHLRRKLEYLADRGALQTTEQFIEKAASASSVSGQPYLVKCGNSAPVESKMWLSEELKNVRSGFSAAGSPAR